MKPTPAANSSCAALLLGSTSASGEATPSLQIPSQTSSWSNEEADLFHSMITVKF